VSEATGVNANDLQLERGRPQVLLHGKGRRDRVVPIPKNLVRSLTDLLSERGLANHVPRPIFVGVYNERLTRFRATHIVQRAASQARSTRPRLGGKPISPHIFRHSLAKKFLRSDVDLLTIQGLAMLRSPQPTDTPLRMSKATAARASGRTTPPCSCWPTSEYYVAEKPWVACPSWR